MSDLQEIYDALDEKNRRFVDAMRGFRDWLDIDLASDLELSGQSVSEGGQDIGELLIAALEEAVAIKEVGNAAEELEDAAVRLLARAQRIRDLGRRLQGRNE